MSLVRWGQDGSSVYVYNDAGTNKIRCCCTPSFLCDTDSGMKAHLIGHKKKGDTIPPWVFKILSGEESKAFYINQP